MEFEINGQVWTIEEVEKEKMSFESSPYTLGLTIYCEQKILILKGMPSIEKTLKHELTHVWLWETGHNQHEEGKEYSYEDVCEIVACSNNFINEIVNKYMEGRYEKESKKSKTTSNEECASSRSKRRSKT